MSPNQNKTIPIGLAIFIATSLIGYGMTQAEVKNNAKAITKLENAPVQIAETTQKVENLDENLLEFKTEQRMRFQKVDEKLDRLLEAIVNR